ncbi:hypothetical protein GBN24_04055 [Plesiomonas shigelloides]|uniref:hypothetical protein n=1 Tax=Plesiomonas shigelloides TaxID=703 RepID=UPI001261F466|nr:hypothetical protein [Plesiomonas shigelloides]KAB7693222.1 hypothetical protein GBN24_04055 [Plesiomonas shigelloides]
MQTVASLIEIVLLKINDLDDVLENAELASDTEKEIYARMYKSFIFWLKQLTIEYEHNECSLSDDYKYILLPMLIDILAKADEGSDFAKINEFLYDAQDLVKHYKSQLKTIKS